MYQVQDTSDRIQAQMKEAEKASDLALLSHTQLMQSLIQARLNHDVHPMTGHAAMLRLANASKAQLGIRGDLGRVHAELMEIGHSVHAEMDEKTYPPAPKFAVDRQPVKALEQTA